MGINRVYDSINASLGAKDYKRMAALLWPALDQFPNDHNLLHFATHLFTVQNQLVPALLCAIKANELEPNQANYTNMGSILRRMNMVPESIAALEEAIGYDPSNKHPWNNLAAAHVNEGNPEPGIIAAKEALRLDPEFGKARWNKGLLELEIGNYAEGFDDYRTGLVIGERLMKTYCPENEPVYCDTAQNLRQYLREHGHKPRIVVWGEQGIGDEIMFSTVLRDLAKDAEIVYDCHPRLEKLMRDSYGDIIHEFYPTRKTNEVPWYADIKPCQFKASTGDLPRWYRRSREAFHNAWGSLSIEPDRSLVAQYREDLEGLAPGKSLVGFASTGGIITTQRWYRCCQLPELGPIMFNDGIQPISLNYEDDTAAVQDIFEKTGKLIYRFPAITQHFDYHHTAALVGALDAVVTVCQSVAHLSAAMGKPTFVMVPSKPAWRYGLEGSTWDWYGNKMLYRATQDGQWAPVIESIKTDLFESLRIRS